MRLPLESESLKPRNHSHPDAGAPTAQAHQYEDPGRASSHRTRHPAVQAVLEETDPSGRYSPGQTTPSGAESDTSPPHLRPDDCCPLPARESSLTNQQVQTTPRPCLHPYQHRLQITALLAVTVATQELKVLYRDGSTSGAASSGRKANRRLTGYARDHLDDVTGGQAKGPGRSGDGRESLMLLKPIRAAHGTACDPRAIADGEPRLRTGSHGHTETAGMNELGRYLRWSEH